MDSITEQYTLSDACIHRSTRGDSCLTLRRGVQESSTSTPLVENMVKKNRSDGTLGPHEGDDNNEEDIGRNEIGSESDDEELPVLPRNPVKRKLTNETKVCERRSQRGRTKSTSPQVKKPRTPQIDPTVIRQLYFARRPPNAVSTATPCSISDA